MTRKNIEIIDNHSWKVIIRSRKQLASYQIPIHLATMHKLDNGDHVSVEFLQNGTRLAYFEDRKLTSGCEILLPKSDQQKLNRSLPLEIRIAGKKILASDGVCEEDIEPASGMEGSDQIGIHRLKERNQKIVQEAKKAWRKADPLLRCSVCRFSFAETYGTLGNNFIEAHHIVPLRTLKAETKVTINQLVPVCSNCHRMLHRKSENLSVEQLRIEVTNSKA